MRRPTLKPARRAELEAEASCPPLPLALHYLWQLFHRLRRRQGSNGFSLSPVSYSEIDAFVRHAGVRLAPWELEVLEDLDDVYRAVVARLHAGEPPTESSR